MRILKLILLLLIPICFACDDEVSLPDLHEIYGKWEAREFLSLESRGYPKNNDYNPTIEFRKDGSLAIKLDINSCFGSFNLQGESGIAMGNSGCTEACCDSEFSSKFVAMLPRVSSYKIENQSLKLYVTEWGWIELVWISE